MTAHLGTGPDAPRAASPSRATHAWFVGAAAVLILVVSAVLAWTGAQPTERASTRTIPDVEIDANEATSPVTASGFRPMLRQVVPARTRTTPAPGPAAERSAPSGRGTGGGTSGRAGGSGTGGAGGGRGTGGGGGGTTAPPPAGGGTTSGPTGPGNSTNGTDNGNGTGNGTPEPGQGIPVVNLPPTAVGPAVTPGVDVSLSVDAKGSVDVQSVVGD